MSACEVKWLLVGSGAIARKRVAPSLEDANGSRLVAVCDIRKEEALSIAADFGADECYTDYGDALARTSADAVYIATPVWLHVDQAVSALQADKHVLVEKPLGLSASECVRAIEAVRGSNKKAACAYYRRFYPRYRYVDEMLKSGEFGEVVCVRMDFQSWFAPLPDEQSYWRVTKRRSGGGPLSDMGSHMFDVLIGLFGLPISVSARCENLVHQWDVEDSSSMIMKLPNGAQVTASIGWNSKTWKHEFEIVGTEARVAWRPYDGDSIVKTVGRETETIDMPNAQNVHLPLVEDFVGVVLNDGIPACPLEEAAKTNLLLDAVYESSAQSREVLVGSQEAVR